MSSDAPRFSTLERVLAYAAAAIIVIAVASYLTTLIVGLAAGREALAHGIWQFVTGVAFYGVPAGFVIMMVLLGISFTRRGRSATRKAQGKREAPVGREADE